ncbi:hypothetical protein HD597_010824 [Nonomuraea thailandensis]|uniref:Uncharacterized protein n=1 Tax=Nonomuraea thailandensis TaxID=1188745 RepID=A0A9X2K8Q6_9ACTN|nr:hypothetical protein [Nonomuraea thailandensis]MCP2363804.1 hypothetical protein [Nonomuraea thailandensis]
MVETAIFGMGDQSHPETARWTCPHGRHVGQGCVPCYRAATAPDPALPLWAAVVWFTSPRPIPIKVLHDVHRHGRHFALDQPSTPLVFLLTGQARAAEGVEAVAGLVGFLLQSRGAVDDFTVTEVRATRY